MTAQDRFQEAYHGFQPAADDNPECIPFYRSHAGLRAAWGEDFCRQHHSLVHECACYCNGDYAKAVQHAKWIGETIKLPEEPSYSYSWKSEPRKPTEADAKEEFKWRFKAAFPGQRLNSREARQKWLEKRRQALKYVGKRYHKALLEYRQDVERCAEENAKRKAEWQGECSRLEALKAAVQSL